jgi:hypothetical protein
VSFKPIHEGRPNELPGLLLGVGQSPQHLRYVEVSLIYGRISISSHLKYLQVAVRSVKYQQHTLHTKGCARGHPALRSSQELIYSHFLQKRALKNLEADYSTYRARLDVEPAAKSTCIKTPIHNSKGKQKVNAGRAPRVSRLHSHSFYVSRAHR